MTQDYFDIAIKEKIWLKKLVEEYDQIIRKYHVKSLKPANLRLSGGTTTLGTWSKNLRTISLSKKLLVHAPWESVIQIFKHEIAHQIADELLGGDDGHGTIFIKACKMIWVEPWARSARVEIGYQSASENSKNDFDSDYQGHKTSGPAQTIENTLFKNKNDSLLESRESSQIGWHHENTLQAESGLTRYLKTSSRSEDRVAEEIFWQQFNQQKTDLEAKKIRERLGKLLALSESSNAHEASIALAKAREMQQGLVLSSLDGYEDFETRIMRPKKKRLERHYSQIAAILSLHYNVRIIFSREFDTKDLSDFQTMEILGQKHTVELAEYVYHFLLKTLRSSFTAESKHRLVDRKSFYSGFLDGLSEKLKKADSLPDRQTECKALILKQNQLLEQYLGLRHPLIITRRLQGRSVDGGSFECGRDKGRKLDIRHPIKSAEMKFLL